MKKSTANLKMLEKLIVSPDTSTLSMASPADCLDCRNGKLLDWSSDWCCAISDDVISVECRRTYFKSYIQI